jgi:phosphoribosylaminoimidazolecarboxamide formyltransferase/IMP cyclohydrolase
MTDLVKIRRALVSVSDKGGLPYLCRILAEEYGIEVVSTGGTARLLQEKGIPVTSIEEVTGFPEIMGGRVKTLHPLIHGGILARHGVDAEDMENHDIKPIDLVIVNLYPFMEKVSSGASPEECNENIDIGGPTMIRAAAKNFQRVTVIVGPELYTDLLSELEENAGSTTLIFREIARARAFAQTARYEMAVHSWCFE